RCGSVRARLSCTRKAPGKSACRMRFAPWARPTMTIPSPSSFPAIVLWVQMEHSRVTVEDLIPRRNCSALKARCRVNCLFHNRQDLSIDLCAAYLRGSSGGFEVEDELP